jgi:hypothetical protein
LRRHIAGTNVPAFLIKRRPPPIAALSARWHFSVCLQA